MYALANKKRTTGILLMISTATAAGATGLLAIRPAVARNGPTFNLQWWSADGGGEMFSTGGGFELGGSIGQHDPNPVPLASRQFELVGGFWAAACDPCDMNCDGQIDSIDIEDFIDLLFAGGTPCNSCTGDVNADGNIDALDIEPFLACLFQ